MYVVLITGCTKYQPTRVVSYEKATYSCTRSKKEVELSVKAFGEKEFKNHFAAFQVLQLHIKNKSAYTYQLRSDFISLPLESAHSVYKKAPSLYFCYWLPTLTFTVLGFFYFWSLCFPPAIAFSLWAPRISKVRNKNERKKLRSFMLEPSGTLAIESYDSVDVLFIVKRSNYSPDFTIKLEPVEKAASVVSAGREQLIFNITVVSRSARTYKTH